MVGSRQVAVSLNLEQVLMHWQQVSEAKVFPVRNQTLVHNLWPYLDAQLKTHHFSAET